MKYKNIVSAIHNFGHSFLSDMNYVGSSFIVDDLRNLNRKEYDILIDWKTKEFSPKSQGTDRIFKSIHYWHTNIEEHFKSHNADFNRLKRFEIVWKAGGHPKVVAIDDRGKLYEKLVTRTS